MSIISLGGQQHMVVGAARCCVHAVPRRCWLLGDPWALNASCGSFWFTIVSYSKLCTGGIMMLSVVKFYFCVMNFMTVLIVGNIVLWRLYRIITVLCLLSLRAVWLLRVLCFWNHGTPNCHLLVVASESVWLLEYCFMRNEREVITLLCLTGLQLQVSGSWY